MLSQRAYRRILEHINHRELDSQNLTHLTLRMDQLQRMSAQPEEVVIDANLLYLENFLPDVCERALSRRTRRNEALVCVTACACSIGKSAPIDFTVRSTR